MLLSVLILIIMIFFMIKYVCPFIKKLDTIQHNLCLAKPGRIQGKTKEKPHQEQGLASLQLQYWHRKP